MAISMLAAIAYGIVHDQITVRLCPEYSTVAHPPLFVRFHDSLTVLAICWGIAATWWMGAFLGVLLALAGTAGRRPPAALSGMFRRIATLLAVMAAGAMLFGAMGYLAAAIGIVRVPYGFAVRIPDERHRLFLADLWAHSASYAVGFFGGLWAIWRVWRQRAAATTN